MWWVDCILTNNIFKNKNRWMVDYLKIAESPLFIVGYLESVDTIVARMGMTRAILNKLYIKITKWLITKFINIELNPEDLQTFKKMYDCNSRNGGPSTDASIFRTNALPLGVGNFIINITLFVINYFWTFLII